MKKGGRRCDLGPAKAALLAPKAEAAQAATVRGHPAKSRRVNRPPGNWRNERALHEPLWSVFLRFLREYEDRIPHRANRFSVAFEFSLPLQPPTSR